MQAVILAGGIGSRLYPLTLKKPKAMIEIKGKPFLLYIIDRLKQGGVTEVILCIGYLADQFKDFFGDGSAFNVPIKYSIENEFMGTGGALKMAERYLENNFIVVNGDTYLPIDYASVFNAFKCSQQQGLIVLYDNHEHIAVANTAVDHEGRVVAYVKNEEGVNNHRAGQTTAGLLPRCQHLDAGVQVFNKRVLELIPANKPVSLEKHLFPLLISQQELAAFIITQRYYDIGTPERLNLVTQILTAEGISSC